VDADDDVDLPVLIGGSVDGFDDVSDEESIDGDADPPVPSLVDPVYKLLGTAGIVPPGRVATSTEPAPPTLVEAITKMSENRPGVGFGFPFHALPKSMQDAWLALMEASMGGGGGVNLLDGSSNINKNNNLVVSSNNQRLLAQLLRNHPEQQNQLRLFMQRSAQQKQQHLRQPLHLSPRVGIHNTPLATSTINSSSSSPSSQLTSPGAKRPEDSTPPTVTLTMLEYYLFLFLRFPLAVPDRNKTPASSIPGVNVHRIPVQRPQNTTPYGDTLYYNLFKRCMRHFLPPEPEENRSIAFIGDQHYESELFLRLIIAMWLEGRLSPTPKVVQTIHERRGGGSADLHLDLIASYDLTVLLQPPTYEPPPAMVRNCVRILLVHGILDPALRRNARTTTAIGPPSLTRYMTTLQPAVYNYIRTSFRYASIHASGSTFFSAMESWLLWVEPWNVGPCKYIAFLVLLLCSRAQSHASTKLARVSHTLFIKLSTV